MLYSCTHMATVGVKGLMWRSSHCCLKNFALRIFFSSVLRAALDGYQGPLKFKLGQTHNFPSLSIYWSKRSLSFWGKSPQCWNYSCGLWRHTSDCLSQCAAWHTGKNTYVGHFIFWRNHIHDRSHYSRLRLVARRRDVIEQAFIDAEPLITWLELTIHETKGLTIKCCASSSPD